jgi:hypothetical protein
MAKMPLTACSAAQTHALVSSSSASTATRHSVMRSIQSAYNAMVRMVEKMFCGTIFYFTRRPSASSIDANELAVAAPARSRKFCAIWMPGAVTKTSTNARRTSSWR